MCQFGSSSGPSAPSTQTTTQTTTASPQAQAMYNQAWDVASTAAARPFQRYSNDPNAFVAGLTPTQQQAIGQAGATMGAYQPYYGAAAGLTGAAGTTSTADVVGQYMSPFMQQVVDPVRGAVEQQQAIQRQRQAADQIKGGAFGQQRGRLERAVLAGQQNLGLGQALSPLYQTGYGQALGAAQGDLARMLQAGGQFGQLGTGAQGAAAQGVQTGLAAGAAQQQTDQAMRDAMYKQFMQEQAYPFLTSQFLTQAAQGLGPGFGQTTTGVQQSLTPLSYWGNPLSDSRVKEGVEGSEAPEPIATTPTGKTIYRYRKINPETGELGPVEFGMMADERAQDTPDAVGQRPDGLLTLDYKRASDDDADAMARMGGAVMDGGDYAEGGSIPYGDMGGYVPMGGGVSPMSPLSSPSLSYAEAIKPTSKFDLLKSGLSNALGLYQTGKELYGDYKGLTSPSKKTRTKEANGGYVPQSGVSPMSPLSAPALAYNRDEEEYGNGGLFGKIGSGVKTAAGLAGAAKTLFDVGSAVAPFVMSLSDPRVKTGVRPAARDGMGIRTGAPDIEDTVTEDVEETPRGGFDEAVKQTLRFEGGLNPNDAGKGPSMRGINQAAHPGIDVTKLTEPQTRDIYYNEYWKGVGADQLPADVRNIVYDTAVMAGPRRAKQLLEVAGTDPDAYMAAREKFLNNLVASNPEKYGQYAKSWANRNAALRSGAGVGTGDVDEVMSNLPLGARRWEASAKEPDNRGFGERLADKFTQNPEQFIIPVLAGLGTMASSGSRFLGPSILQGIGGGAKAYAELAQQQFEREKMGEELGLRRGELGLKGRATDVAERELGIKEREQKRKLDAAAAIAKTLQGGASSVPYGTTPPTDVRPPVAKTSEAAPTGEAPIVAKDPMPAANNAFWANVDPQSNPHILDATAQRFENAAIAAGQAGDTELGKSLLASAQQYRTAASAVRKEGRVLTNRGEVALIPGFGEAAADVKRMEEEAAAGVRVPTEQQIEENKAKIGRKYAPVVSPTGTKYMPPEDETASPPVTAPIAPPEGRPTKAEMEPKSGRISTAIPAAPQGGGMMVDPSLPPGAKVAELSPQNAAIVENDKKFFGDFMERMPATETALQRYKNIAQALKIAESGSTADQRLAFSTLASTLGYQDLAEKVSQGDPAALELVKKNALNAVLDTLKAATPRFAQQEFVRLSDQGVPSPDRLPRTNFEMASEAIGTLERQKAFARDWSQAQKEGWVSPTSFWQSWSEANPLDSFIKAAGRQLGNFKGMPLPPAKDWAEGSIYVVPTHLSPTQATHMGRKGLKAGDMFMFGGWGEGGDPVMRPISKSEAYSAHRGVQ